MSRGAREAAEAASPHVLREYSLIADGERAVLVGPRGEYAWMCFPSFDSDAIFSSLIGGRGAYVIAPPGRFVWGGCYEERSLIWRSRWITADAVIECREALALPATRERAIILRRLEAVAGEARLRVVLQPRAGFGSEGLRGLARDEHGCWRGRTGEVHVAWSGAKRARVGSDGHGGKLLELELKLKPGETHELLLQLAHGSEPPPPPDPGECWQQTQAEWSRRVPSLSSCAAPRDASHACAVLTGLSGEGGGIVAAATSSLPERARKGRNYDYRYVWIRDQCYAGHAFARAGADERLDATLRFVRERLLADGDALAPAYTARGARVPRERRIALPGYPGGSDVVGNHVRDQFQLDIFGEALLLLAAAAERDLLDAEGWRAAELACGAIERRWREPEAGLWELDPKRWTHSRMVCAAGLKAISAHAPSGAQTPSWLALADTLLADLSAHAVHPSGRWQRSPEDARVDAALLFGAIRGAFPAEDPRALATLHAVEQELVEDHYCYRFRHDARPLGEAEGAFLLCGYVMSLAWAQQGRAVEAARWFERNRSACGPPGLFCEEFDVLQRQLRGNMPQAFVHALLLESAFALQLEN